MKYEKCKVILVETREKNGTFKVSPSGKMYPCYMYSNTWYNLLYSLGIKRASTKHVDLELHPKWYYKIGYFILSCCYLKW